MISNLRRVAQAVRHAPILRSLTPLWGALRVPYLRVLRKFGSSDGVAVKVGDVEMRLHPNFATQNWETVEFAAYRAFAALLCPGDIVYDVGAHIGTYTLMALKGIGAGGRVIAYEPFAFTRRYLAQHLEWNGNASRVMTRPVCCGAVPGQRTFYFAPDRAEGMNGLVPVEGFSEQMVEVTTLDREVMEIGLPPSVIKIDVEGAEWDVLRGAEAILRDHRPRLALSLHPAALAKQGASAVDVLGWLEALGYDNEIVARDHEIHVISKFRQPT